MVNAKITLSLLFDPVDRTFTTRPAAKREGRISGVTRHNTAKCTPRGAMTNFSLTMSVGTSCVRVSIREDGSNRLIMVRSASISHAASKAKGIKSLAFSCLEDLSTND